MLVNVSDSHQISCTLFGAGTEDPSLDGYLSIVMKRYDFLISVQHILTASEDADSGPIHNKGSVSLIITEIALLHSK